MKLCNEYNLVLFIEYNLVFLILHSVLPYEKMYLDNLPCAEMYQTSYMHRDVITHITPTKSVHLCYSTIMSDTVKRVIFGGQKFRGFRGAIPEHEYFTHELLIIILDRCGFLSPENYPLYGMYLLIKFCIIISYEEQKLQNLAFFAITQ